MYRPNVITSTDVMNYIDGTDIYNSMFISEILKAPHTSINLENSKLSRIDLISSTLYSDPKLKAGLLGVVNGFDFINFDKVDGEIKYIETSVLSRIVNKV